MMTHTELKQAILDYLKFDLGVLYIGNLKIDDLLEDGKIIGHKVSFYFNNSENPTAIMADLVDDEFVEFIKEELRKSKFHKTEYYEVTKLPPTFTQND